MLLLFIACFTNQQKEAATHPHSSESTPHITPAPNSIPFYRTKEELTLPPLNPQMVSPSGTLADSSENQQESKPRGHVNIKTPIGRFNANNGDEVIPIDIMGIPVDVTTGKVQLCYPGPLGLTEYCF